MVSAQEVISFPSLQANFIDSFDELETFPNICFESVWRDEQGRVFINSCTHNNQFGALFFQFDGTRFYPHQPLPDFDYSQIQSVGFCQSNYYYGYIAGQGPIFLTDLNSYETETFPLDKLLNPEERIVNFKANKQGEWVLFTQEKQIYRLYSWSSEQLTLLTEIRGKNKESQFANARRLALYHNQKEIWFIDETLSIYRFDKTTKKYSSFDAESLLSYSDFRNRQVARNFYNIDFLEGHKGEIYLDIPIYENALYQYNRKTSRFEPLEEFPIEFQPEMMFKDEDGNLLFKNRNLNSTQWLLKDTIDRWFDYSPVLASFSMSNNQIFGAFRREIYIIKPNKFIHVSIQEPNEIKTYFSKVSMRGIGAINENQIWAFGTGANGGWFLIDDKKQQVQRSILTCPSEVFSNKSGISQIVKDPKGRLWASRPRFLSCYDPADNTCISYPTEDRIVLFTLLKEDQIAFISRDKSLQFFDIKTQEITLFREDGQIKHFNRGVIQDLKEGPDGLIWIATSLGFWKIDPEQESSQLLGTEEPFVGQGYYCIHPAQNGKLWLGTYYSGVQVYDPPTGQVDIISADQGLSNNSVVSITADNEGDMWVGTYNGLTLISPELEVLTTIHPENGLNGKEFNRYSYGRTPEGRILLGTTQGLNILDPQLIKSRLRSEKNISIYLHSLSYYDAKGDSLRIINKNLEKITSVQLPAANRFLGLRFALSNNTQPHLNRFAYQLIPQHQKGSPDWVYLGTQQELNLANLPAGRYNLYIRGSDFQGNWSSEPVQLAIHAKEFFYKQTWFYLCCGLFLLLVGLLWVRRIQLENVRLEREVAIRTQKIQEDKAVIEKQAEKLKALDEMKSRFFTNISHELRTPLTIITGMVDQIKENPGHWLQKGHKMIKRNANNLLDLVNQILDLRKLESGSLKLSLIQGDIMTHLRYISESFQSYAQSKSITLHFLSDESEIIMDYDPEKILRIVSNLLSNAIKFTPEGGHVYFTVKQKGATFLQLRVKDTGPGIPPDQRPHIFGRFYQADASDGKDNVYFKKGTGIGLTLARELVTLMQGSIKVGGKVGEGSIFIVLLPITQNAPLVVEEDLEKFHQAAIIPTAKEALKSSKPENSNQQKTNLLIIEDNSEVAQYLISCLDADYQIEVAVDGEDGIDKALEQIPDIIITDVMMPKKDGFEVCDTLKNEERTSHIPIIMLTAKADMESKLKGLKRGAEAYLTKPFNKEELLIRMRKMTEIRATLQQRYRLVSPLHLPPQGQNPMEDAFIQRVNKAIEKNMADEDFDAIRLCRTVGMSRAHLYRKLKALTDQSVSHYIRLIRLHKSRELLQNSDLKVSEIAHRVGFRDPKYFSRVFSEEFGISPNEIR